MTILDEIKLNGETKKRMEHLSNEYQYDPTRIGCAILRALGYEVKQHLEGSISVKDENGRFLFYSD